MLLADFLARVNRCRRVGERAVPDQPQAMHRQVRVVQCIICTRLV